MAEQGSFDWSKWVAIGVAVLAAIIAGGNSYVTYLSYNLNSENQKAALFSQFQSEYSGIASRFPPRLLEPNFTPPRGSPEYKRLQDYWIFCYAEWYQTKRPGQKSFSDMWDSYYAGLISNSLEIPSLRYVIQDMMKYYGLKRATMRDFYGEIRALAEQNGQPIPSN